MTIKEALRRVAYVLELLRDREHGRLKDLAVAIGKDRSYMTKLPKTEGYRFTRLLAVIGAYREEPGRFFARAFDISPDPDAYLEDLLRPGEEEPILGRIERVTRRIEHEPPPEGEPSTSRATVEDLNRSCRSDQRKRLQNVKKFQTVAFLRRYLVYLDDLRYESPADSAFLAESLARGVVERVIGSKTERLELQCRALGAYGSAHRVRGNFPTAAKAIVLGLEVARRNDLEITVADLLQRGAYVLHDQAQSERALRLLENAHMIYYDLGMTAELGRVQADRASMFSQLGEHSRSKRAFHRALELLPEYEERNRLSAMHGVALAHYNLGEFDSAQKWLNEVLPTSHRHGGAIVAKLIWLRGLILGKKEQHGAATQSLHEALQMLSAREVPLDVALLGLDLTASLLKEGKRSQALTVVRNMTVLTVRFRGNKLAEGALVELTEAGLHGKISQELIDRTAEKLKKGAPKGGRALCKS